MIRIKRGLNLPISGEPDQSVLDKHRPQSVALLGRDYIGMKPTMAVAVGDRVKLGQALFSDKKNPQVTYAAPGAGIVSAINRGYQRKLLSLVIDLDRDLEPETGAEEQVQFNRYDEADLSQLDREQVVADLLKSGLWTAIRKRPFSKVPAPSTTPKALFVNVMDSNPLAASPAIVMKGNEKDFQTGVNLLAHLPEQSLYLCLDDRDSLNLGGLEYHSRVKVEQFRGPHPAGLSGTHIHYLRPAGVGSEVWYLGYQDVIAIGKLFRTGTLSVDRTISLSGPQVREPRLIKTRLGANLDELMAGELKPHESRIVSGSVLAGATAQGAEAFLGRYHQQVTAVREGRERPLLGYLSPGANRHSVMGIYLSSFYKSKRFPLSTSTQGSERAMVPIGAYEKVVPLDVLPTQLLRALIVGDLETAQNLGALELDEEDLALCSYVCPGKYEYGSILRDNLTRIEKES